MNAEQKLREKFGDFDVDVDVMRDVYMTHHQRECYNRILARALTRPAPSDEEVEAAAKRMAETPVQCCGDFETVRYGEILSVRELSDLARAALGVG